MRRPLVLAALLFAAPLAAQVVRLPPPAGPAAAGAAGASCCGACFRPAAHDWSATDHAMLSLSAAQVVPALAGVRWQDPESRAALAPVLRHLEARGHAPEAFAELPAERRDDEVFGAALEARRDLSRSLEENARAAASAAPGAAELPRAVARLDLLRGLYAPYLSPAERAAASAAYQAGLRKLSEQQAASIGALAHRMALALGASVDEARAAAAEAARRPEALGFFTPHRGPAEAKPAFVPPRPNPAVMAATTPLARWLMFGLPVLRRVPWLRDLPFVRGYFRLRGVDLPDADAARLRAAVNPRTAAFLTPNHPEFMTDWLIDKELSARFAPRMASWAAGEYVKTIFPWFWSRNNLVPNDGGRPGMDYSTDWALKGNVVLLHPEGNVRWTGDKVHPLYPGAAEMALETAAKAQGRPVFVAPVVWKAVHQTDIAPALNAEMGRIERALGLPLKERYRGPVEMRFFRLQRAVLRRQMRRFGMNEKDADPDYFAAQQRFRARLIADLLSRHPVEIADSEDRTLRRIEKALRAEEGKTDPALLREDRARLAETRRLGGFSRAAYNTPALTQEQIFESLKRVRATLMAKGLAGMIERFFPKPLGPRVLHVRAAEPIRVEPGADRDELLKRTHDALQGGLDALNAEVAPETARFARPNPFYVPAPAPEPR